MCNTKSFVERFRNDIGYTDDTECDEEKSSGCLRLQLPDVFRWIAKSAFVAGQRQDYAKNDLARDFQRTRPPLGRDSHRDEEARNGKWNYGKATPK
jgi:hypothetical protein